MMDVRTEMARRNGPILSLELLAEIFPKLSLLWVAYLDTY